jgi:hypothetical protein
MDPGIENDLMQAEFDVNVHVLDPDQQHIQTHMALLQHPSPVVQSKVKAHIQLHQIQMAAKNQAQAAAQQQQMGQSGPPGAPGGPTPPVPGGQAPGPRLIRGVPGAIHPDQMPRAGALVMPRRAG